MLLIDSGNSAIKCRLLVKDRTLDQRFPVFNDPDCRAFGDYLSTINASRIVLACVSGSAIHQRIIDIVHQFQPMAKFTELKSLPELNGLKNGYHDFTRLGVDRWLTMMALTPLKDKDFIVIDAGSAITIDLVSRTKGHLGGAILPGFKTDKKRFQSLFPHVDFTRLATVRIKNPGRDTATCIDLSQAPYSVDGVLSILEHWLELLLPPCEILLTGQDAGRISERLNLPNREISDLVFSGMLKQYQLQG